MAKTAIQRRRFSRLPPSERCVRFVAFSSEVVSGSREENASKTKLEPGSDLNQNQALIPFVENQERACSDEGKAQRVIPAQRLLEIQHREAGEHDPRDYLLHGLELGCTIHPDD